MSEELSISRQNEKRDPRSEDQEAEFETLQDRASRSKTETSVCRNEEERSTERNGCRVCQGPAQAEEAHQGSGQEMQSFRGSCPTDDGYNHETCKQILKGDV